MIGRNLVISIQFRSQIFFRSYHDSHGIVGTSSLNEMLVTSFIGKRNLGVNISYIIAKIGDDVIIFQFSNPICKTYLALTEFHEWGRLPIRH
jgi:hypothetical protein